MPQNIHAKIVRLRAMSAVEISYRLFLSVRERLAAVCRRQHGAESTDQFICRLAGDRLSPANKVDLLFDHFRAREMFAWQMAPDQCRHLYDENFVAHRQSTLQVAARAMRHEFILFGRRVAFAGDIDWHYDPLQGKSLPLRYCREMDYYSGDTVREVKYVWELNRCQHFVTLGKAYFLTGDEAYAESLCGQWVEWLERNPCRMGINWSSSLECALRMISWTWALAFIRRSGRLDPDLYIRILHSIWQHASFVRGHLSRFSSANNHLIGEALGLIYAGCCYPELREAGRWRDDGFRILFRELIAQIHQDGVAKEQTTHYQRYLFDFSVLAITAAEHAGRTTPPRVMERVEKMADFYLALCDESGAVPHIGDEDGGEALRLVEAEESPCHRLLSTAAALFGRPDCKLASGLSEATLWLLGEDGVRRYQRLPEQAAARRLQVFERGGYVVLSQQKPRAKMVFDCGPLGYGKLAAHGHADALSFTLSVRGQEALIDCGTFLYLGAGPERDYYRSTRAHNTIATDGLSQSMPLGPFQWGRRATCRLERAVEEPECLLVQAVHDGYRRVRVRHTRQIEQRDDRWVVKDFISGLGYHKIDAYFHLAPCSVTQRGRTLVADFGAFSIEFECTRAAEQDDILVETAWHSPAFGQREQHPVLRRQVSGTVPLHLATVLRVYE